LPMPGDTIIWCIAPKKPATRAGSFEPEQPMDLIGELGGAPAVHRTIKQRGLT